MAWAVITHREKLFTNSSKNRVGKILSVKMIILGTIPVYALAQLLLVTPGTVKHFPNERVSVGFSSSCASSQYNGISEETFLPRVPLHFLPFSVLSICFTNLSEITRILLCFLCGFLFQIVVFSGKMLKSDPWRQWFQNGFSLTCRRSKNLVPSSSLRATF